MREPRRQYPLRTWPQAFLHPLFWCALGLLLLNDLYLKRALILPGELTGKLSDFTGLLVAPPLLAWFLGVRKGAVRWLAPALVGLGFAAIKLDPLAARMAESVLDAALVPLGFRSRIWVDPSDLYALCVLPIAGLLCLPVLEPRGVGRALAARLAIVTSAFACIATTGGDDEKGSGRSDAPTLVNDTEDELIVQIASTEGAGGCRIYREDRIGLLTKDAFVTRREVKVGAGKRAALVAGSKGFRACGAAWIALPDGSEQLVYWRDLEAIESFVDDDDKDRAGRQLILRGERNRFRFEIGDDLNALELGGEVPGSTCVEPEVDHSVELTPLATTPGYLELGERSRDADGCLVVEWFVQHGDAEPDMQRLCIPDWAFPFEEGEVLSVVEELDDEGGVTLRITRFVEGAVDQRLTIWNRSSTLAGSQVDEVVGADCIGSLSECGAYVRPIEVVLKDDDEGVLVGGDEADLDVKSDDIRMLVGAGRDVGWSSATCTGDEVQLGPRVNLLELRSD